MKEFTQTPGTSTSQICTQDPTYCSDTRCDAEHDDGQWNERLGVERQFGWRQFERRSRRRWAVCPQRPMWAMVCPWMPGVNATERRVGLQRQSPVPFSGLPERRSGSRRGAGLLIPPHHR
jgi:hypothetical protein